MRYLLRVSKPKISAISNTCFTYIRRWPAKLDNIRSDLFQSRLRHFVAIAGGEVQEGWLPRVRCAPSPACGEGLGRGCRRDGTIPKRRKPSPGASRRPLPHAGEVAASLRPVASNIDRRAERVFLDEVAAR